MVSTQEKIFLSLSNDTVFKYLFKKEKYRRWLEEIILDQTDINLDGYKLIDNELNSGSKYKDYRLDLLFEKDDELIVVEMNTSNLPSNLYKNYSYLFRIAGSRYDKKEKIYNKKITRLIIINSYTSTEAPGIPVLFFYLQDKNNGIKRDMIESYEIYLPSSDKKEYNNIEKRLLLFGAESYSEMRKITNDPEDIKVIEELEKLSMDDYFRYMYNEKEVNERLMNSRYEEGLVHGFDQGKESGFEEGTKKEKIEIAKTMLEDKIDLEIICKYTGLTIEEVNNLNNI